MNNAAPVNANYRRDAIPWWIYAINGCVIAILIFQMISCFYNPSWAYGAYDNRPENHQVIWALAGRNLVMIVVTAMAMASQNAMFLAYTYLMNIVRELYDMFLMGALNDFNASGLMTMASFLIFLIPYYFALKNLRKIAAQA